MPLDGTSPRQVDLTLEKLGILARLASLNQDSDQSRFDKCLWSEARRDTRLVELGLPVDDSGTFGYPGPQKMAEFLFGKVTSATEQRTTYIFGSLTKREKHWYLTDLIGRVSA